MHQERNRTRAKNASPSSSSKRLSTPFKPNAPAAEAPAAIAPRMACMPNLDAFRFERRACHETQARRVCCASGVYLGGIEIRWMWEQF